MRTHSDKVPCSETILLRSDDRCPDLMQLPHCYCLLALPFRPRLPPWPACILRQTGYIHALATLQFKLRSVPENHCTLDVRAPSSRRIHGP